MRTVQQLTSRLAVPTQWSAAGDQVLLMVDDIKEMYTGMLHSRADHAVLRMYECVQPGLYARCCS